MAGSRAWIVVALAGTLVLTSCGGGETAGPACGSLEGTEARSSRASTPDVRFLTEVEADSDECVDRVTFNFRGDADGSPGFRVQYLPASLALTEDGSGDAVDVNGSAFLVVRLEPAATAEASGDQLTLTYLGSKRLRPRDARFVREVVKTGDFEAAVTWVIGLREQRPFRVTGSSSPPQVVVEIG